MCRECATSSLDETLEIYTDELKRIPHLRKDLDERERFAKAMINYCEEKLRNEPRHRKRLHY